MKLSKILSVLALVCIVIALGMYIFAYKAASTSFIPEVLSPSHGKLSTASVEDGTYMVRIRSLTTTSDETSVTFAHVTYFEGGTASSSARHEVKCPEDQPLEACVPTLIKGFYVRESGADTFTAPVTKSTIISLHDSRSASVTELRDISRQFDPVFEIVIHEGVLESITERSPL